MISVHMPIVLGKDNIPNRCLGIFEHGEKTSPLHTLGTLYTSQFQAGGT